MNKIKYLDLKQLAVKRLINSIYGASGNEWFYFYNIDIAQSITLQGQDVIKFAIQAVNKYFKEKWHVDYEAHKELGLNSDNINKIEEDCAIYTDTDSIYVWLGVIFKYMNDSSSYSMDDKLRLCAKLSSYRLSDYFKKIFESYKNYYNTKVNNLDFELENLSSYAFWIKKKNYALRVSYEPNKEMKLLKEYSSEYSVIKGLESIRKSYPMYIRNILNDFFNTFLIKGKNINYKLDVIYKLKELKKEFITRDIDDISMNINIKKYNEHVKSEYPLILNKGATIFSKAVAYHNNLLYKTDYINKYPKIRIGDTIKIYACDENEHNYEVFAYIEGNHPSEIAPDVDYDEQFHTLIISPINRFLSTLGFNELDKNLNPIAKVIRTTKRKYEIKDLYPFYVINDETLEYEEIDKKYWNLFDGSNECNIKNYDEYLNIINKFGINNTSVVSNLQLEKYIAKMKKKLNKDNE